MTEHAKPYSASFRAFELKMEAHGMLPTVVNIFKRFYEQLLSGEKGFLPETAIDSVGSQEVKEYAALDQYADAGMQALGKTVVIKLNGGLGTSMGLEQAKSLIQLKDGLSFLEIILRQTECLRSKYKVMLPLVLMNSFKTHMDSMLRVENFDNGETAIPLAFVQNRFPKIFAENFLPATWKNNPELEWNPPGHGDIYPALVTSGLLKDLLRKGFTYAFISNSDNLGAIMDERILGYMAQEKLPFLMEVAKRTKSDRKGGHLARHKRSGRLLLREVAQCPEQDEDAFGDIEKHRYFNTNSLWLDLKQLEHVFLTQHMMPLDLIVNPKNLDPRDPDSPKVFQIESAMGSAISAFENAKAVCVPRTRFAPVKTTNDLLLVMSDCYLRTEDETLVPNPERKASLPVISLDSSFYKKVDDFAARFHNGPPSLLQCEKLTVEGDVLFGNNVVLRGNVTIRNTGNDQVIVPDGAVLEGENDLS